MKSYDEVARNVLRRRDEHDVAAARRNRMATRIGVPVVSLCLAAIVGVGFWQAEQVEDPPLNIEDAVVPGIDDLIEPGETEAYHYLLETEPAVEIVTAGNDVPVNDPDEEKDECVDGSDEIWIEPRWGEKMLYSKYPEFELGGITYTTAATWIDGVKLGIAIGTATAYGYDVYEDKAYEMNVTVYPINGISTDAAVAVSYDGFTGKYAVYTDHWYKPATLGEFIDALGLRDNLTFGTIYHTYWEYESYITVEYAVSDPAVIWDMLLSDGTLVNVADEVSDHDMSFYKEDMSVSVSVDILGVNNVSLGVTENGYLTTNILATRKLFYIGEDKVQEFIRYVEANFENVREDRAVATTTAVDEPEYPTDTVMTAVTQISPPYDPRVGGVEE